jgi:Ca2+-binding RTX toxin-like protein
LAGDAGTLYDSSTWGDDNLTGGENSEENSLIGDASSMYDSSTGVDDTLNGSEGAYILYGDARNMTYTVSDHPANTSAGGNDILNGNGGNDTLYGDAELMTAANIGGNDILNGGTGNDDLWGNSGLDTFVFDLGSDEDTIHDYVIADDNIDIDAYLDDGLDFDQSDVTTVNVTDSLVELGVGNTITVLNVDANLLYADIADYNDVVV